MNTPPPENEFPTLSLMPSFSMPVLQPAPMDSSTACGYKRRRHTLTRPDGALALLSDNSDEGETEDQVLDRISDTLSTLIQEANLAVRNHGLTESRAPRPPSTYMRTMPTLGKIPSRSKSSRLPRPKARSHWIHDRHSSISSTASLGSLFSPVPIIESPITASSIEDYHPLAMERVDIEAARSRKPKLDDPLLESFRRLDSSMALVDSLSRDLTQQEDEQHSNEPYTLLLLLPLLHIPHALITAVFDTLLSPHTTTRASFENPTTSPSISGIMAWSIFFALANILVARSTPPFMTQKLALPGTYLPDVKLIRRPTPIDTTLTVKRSSRHRSRKQTRHLTISSNDPLYIMAGRQRRYSM